MHFLFLSKFPVNEPPLGSPTGPLWRELPVYKALFFYMCHKFLIKTSLNKEFFPSLKGPRKGASLYVPQKRGPYGNRRPFPEPYLACGPGSAVGIATDYGLDGPGSNPGGDEIFRPSRPTLGPTQPPVKWVPVLSPGVKCGRGVLLTTHPLLVSRS